VIPNFGLGQSSGSLFYLKEKWYAPDQLHPSQFSAFDETGVTQSAKKNALKGDKQFGFTKWSLNAKTQRKTHAKFAQVLL
jgi:hypothetical protein